MTEPREPEPTLDDGEATRPIEVQKPEPATWYAVEARPEDAGPEVGGQAPEPAGGHEVAVEPPAEPPTVAFVGEPDETAPAAQTLEEETAELRAVAQPAPAAEPEAAGEPPAMVAPEPEPEPVPEPVPVPEPEPVADVAAEETALPADEPTRPLFGGAEPTIATEAPAALPAEETVALPVEPVGVEPLGVEPTAVLPHGMPAQPFPVLTVPTESIFRQPSPPSPGFEHTRVEPLGDEEQKLAAERAARRDARATALAAPAPVPLIAPEPVIVHKRTNDKFWGSLGLFLLRLVLAAILAVRGLNLLTDIPAAQAAFARTIIPYPGIMAIVTGVAALLIALSLVLGLLTRLAGLGIALIGGGALAFVYWGNWSPFIAGRPGFLGDYELLLAAVGVLLLCIGAGGWSLDRSVRAGRARNKAERAAASQ